MKKIPTKVENYMKICYPGLVLFSEKEDPAVIEERPEKPRRNKNFPKYRSDFGSAADQTVFSLGLFYTSRVYDHINELHASIPKPSAGEKNSILTMKGCPEK
ncbi:MAG: hypothetical protein AB9861_05370 [Methanosarcina sp.]|jgi:hypothetical protein